MLRWIVLVLFVSVLTGWICLFKPVLHKSIVVTNAGMKVVEEPPVETPNNVQLRPIEQQTSQSAVKVQQKPVKTVPQQSKTPVKTVTKTVQPKQNTTKSTPKKVTQPAKKTVKPVQQKAVKAAQQKTVVPKTKTTAPQTSKTTAKTTKSVNTQQKVLTQQEETILWNKWHSSLQNRIISDTTARLKKLDSTTKQAINGTLYIMYSFTVSKNGSISNISVKTNISNEASQQVKSIVTSLISGYRGSSLLAFPKGTIRVTEQHKGAISTIVKNAQSTTYSNTNDYNRYNETVKR